MRQVGALYFFMAAVTVSAADIPLGDECGERSWTCTDAKHFIECVEMPNNTMQPLGAPQLCPGATMFCGETAPCVERLVQCNDNGWACVDDQAFIVCVEGNGDIPSEDLYTCPLDLYCTDEPINCAPLGPATTTEVITARPNTTTTSVITTTPLVTMSTTVATPAVMCSVEGRFPDLNSCARYYICVPKSSGGFYHMYFSCPEGSSFDPVSLSCSFNSSVACCETESGTTTQGWKFECTTSGRFPDSANCANYFLCIPNSNGGFYEQLLTCPSMSMFNPTTGRCSLNTYASCRYSTSTVETITGPPPPVMFTCQSQGRFPDPTSCARYYICTTSSIGGFYQKLYNCPKGMMFNSVIAKCSLAEQVNCNVSG